jgi:hypothetical protein
LKEIYSFQLLPIDSPDFCFVLVSNKKNHLGCFDIILKQSRPGI